ncbi:RNA methyltransferase, TrmH family [Hyphomonas neptunium ATCC 15444]|uniref:RNA methyltransferase, TrmH family n=2 Tax=Hyphomonas TaxID=85 RepID=Q0C5D5_HYPNA|nr:MULTISPECIES: RNA methyltransferase [Hyphomonas]ABI77876.1 RNA methyltransferase, TrmH family [Hyphomonas neptunium ATCC 15444]KCZ95492.1 RNA methyltransferase [Hyphomonas hirschiana VP5]
MPEIIPIHDANDPRVEAYVSIRERDLTGGHGGRFIVEGKVTLETLLARSRFEVESLFLCETRLAPLAGILSEVPEGVPVYVAAQGVMDAVAGFPMHRGVLACGRKGAALSPQNVLPKDGPSTALILSELSNHDNVGACFRNAAAFGADAVLLDAASCDPLYRKAIRVSSGAALWLPFSQGGTGADLIAAAEAAGHEVWALTPRSDAAPLPSLKVPERVALLMGAEGPGLPAEMIARARPVRIAMTEGFDSVNVATAAAIALAHVFAARG